MLNQRPDSMSSKKKITFVMILLVVLIIIFIIFTFPAKHAEAPISSNVPKDMPSYSSIAHTFAEDAIETSSISIHIKKPVVSGLSSEVVDSVVNDKIQSIYKKLKDSFIAETDGIETFSPETKHQLTVNGSAPFSPTEKTFYIDTEIYSYYSGSAHPLSQRIVSNFVTENGQLIRLEDILKKDEYQQGSVSSSDIGGLINPDLEYKTALTAIAKIAKPKIIEQLTKAVMDNSGEGNGADSFAETGADPRMENYRVFYIHGDRIEWVFGQYQVAPYVFGEIKISIPMNTLRPYLAPRTYLK